MSTGPVTLRHELEWNEQLANNLLYPTVILQAIIRFAC